jgi:hypothetical protein
MDTQLLPYRLKSARRKKRLQKEDRDKQLLRLYKERERISNDPDYKIVVPLDEPYQRGWKRLFVLKKEVQKSNLTVFYQQILDQINMIQYHYDASFKKRKRSTHRHGYRCELPKLQSISRFDWNMNKHKLSDEQRCYFSKIEFWEPSLYSWDYKYEFANPELFELKILPHIVNTITEVDIMMARRLSFIDDYMEKNGMNYRLTKLKGGYYKYWKRTYDEKIKYISPFKNKPKWDVADLDL